MRKHILFTCLAPVLLAASGQAQTGCVLGSGVPLPNVVSAQTNVKVAVELRGGPAFTSTVLQLTDTGSGQCRIHVTPPAGITDFRVTLTPTVTGTAIPVEKQVTARIITLDADHLEWSMEPARLVTGVAVARDATIKPLTRGAREYALALVVSDTIHSDTLPFAVLWAPAPDIRLTTVRQTCGANVCFYAGQEQDLEIGGLDAGEVDVQGGAKTDFLNAAGALSGTQSPAVRTKTDGVFLSVTPTAGVQRMAVTLPLRVERVRPKAGGGFEPFSEFLDTVAVRTETAPAQLVSFNYADGDRLDVLRGASLGVRVHLKGTAALNLENGTSYQLRELVMGAQGVPVAEFYVDNAVGNEAAGTLLPIAPTRTRSGRDGAPELVLMVDPVTKRQLRIHLTVLPPTRVERVYVKHADRTDELNGVVHPQRPALLRIEGPGVGYLTRATFGTDTAIVRTMGARDSIEVLLQVPKFATVSEPLRLRDVDGAEVVVPITVQPNQRPNTRFDYVTLQYRLRSRSKELGFTPPPSAGNRKDGRPWNEVEAATLGGVVLLADPTRVDGDTLYGVQYLQLDVDLYDAAGDRSGTLSQCVAVVPPPVGEREYPLRANCTRIVNGEYPISELLDASTRATARSLMRVRLRHDGTQYPNDDVGEVRELKVRRRGRFVLEPRLQLPGPVMAWHRGRTTPGITYAGALFSIQPLIGNNWLFNRAHNISVQTGFLVGTVPSSSTSSEGLGGRLSATLGASYLFRNMLGNLALDFYGGRVWPIGGRGIRERDAYWVFRPGFSVPLGGSSGK